jgi:hypothetical protein
MVEVRNDVELILQGVLAGDMPRNDVLLLANKSGWEELRKVRTTQ